jgi:SAM-dependent methyltransferase
VNKPGAMGATDVYADDELAGLYDLVYAGYDDDIDLYEQFARRAGPVLELCAGSGRVTLPLIDRGIEVIGLDFSAPMLARLDAAVPADARSRIRLVEGDMRTFDLGEQFDLVYCAFGSFEQLLTSDDQLACLRTVARHLTTSGRFVAELRSLTAIDWDPEPTLIYEWTRADPATGEPITKLRSQAASRARQITVDTVFFDRSAADGTIRRRQIEVAMRAIGRYELEFLLHEAGLRLTDVYGDTDLSPYDDASDRMIVVAALA